jgi:hypothetical protein
MKSKNGIQKHNTVSFYQTKSKNELTDTAFQATRNFLEGGRLATADSFRAHPNEITLPSFGKKGEPIIDSTKASRLGLRVNISIDFQLGRDVRFSRFRRVGL